VAIVRAGPEHWPADALLPAAICGSDLHLHHGLMPDTRRLAAPDDPITGTGVLSELSAGGSARSGRSDRRHQVLDPFIVAGPWVAGAGAAVLGIREVARALRGWTSGPRQALG